MPRSALVPADGGQPRPVSIGLAMPLGWTTDGRAIVFRPETPGCDGGAKPGVYLVTADGEAALIARTRRDEPPSGLAQSIEPRSAQAVTRAAMP